MTAVRQIDARLSASARKRAAYAEDTYFQEAHEQLEGSLGDAAEFARSHALLLLKPDAVAARQLLTAIDWTADQGFRIVAAERVRIDRHLIRALWYFQWNIATPERRRIADLLVSASDSLVLVVRKEDCGGLPASVHLTELKGPTDPGARVPGQLRHLLGRHTYLLNLVHTPDEPADVLRELAIYFGAAERAAICAQIAAGDDRRDDARALARALYAGALARSLDLAPAVARLAQEVRTGLTGVGDAARAELEDALDGARLDPRNGGRLLRAAWRHGLAIDEWSAIVAGSHLMPMRVNGRDVVLGGTSPDDWRDRPEEHPRPFTSTPSLPC